MKTLTYLFLILNVNFIFGQNGWFFQNPYYTQNDLLNIQILSSDTGYVTGNDGTIIRITNRGNSWSNVYSNITQNINSHYFLNSHTGYCIADRKLNKTINGGSNWTIVQTGFIDELVSVQFINDDTGFVSGAYGKVLKTTNGGINWSVKDLNTFLFINKIFFINANIGYCTAANFIYKTIDSGENWILQNTNTFNVIHSVYFINELNGFACGAHGLLLNTTNGGVNWQSKNIQMDINMYSIKFLNSNTGFCAGNLLNTAVIMKTTDSGNNWIPQFVPSFDTLKSLWILDSLNIISSGNNGFITKSTDANTWIPISYITTFNLNSIYFPTENTGYCVGDKGFDFINFNQHGIIMKTTNSGINWNVISTNNGCNFSDVHFLNDNTGFIAGDSTNLVGTIFKTTNGGTDWVRTVFYKKFLKKIYFLDENKGFACGSDSTGGLIMGTTDGGNHWFDVKNFPQFISISSIFFTDELTGFGVGNDHIFSYGYFFKTTDGGKEWSSSFIANKSVHYILFIDQLTGYVSGNEVILKTTNAGGNWSQQNFPGIWYLNSIYFTNSSNGYCVGINGKILLTRNSGNSWISQNSIVHENLNSIYFTNSSTGYAAGNRGAIIKTINGGSVNINETESIIPDNYILYQNFPNPFNPSTTINYELRSASYISLKVFDILGKEVSVLVNEKQSTGSYSIQFNGTNLSSGIYIYRLEAGDFVDCKMMALIK